MTGALFPLVAALALQLEPVPGAPFASPTGPIRARTATGCELVMMDAAGTVLLPVPLGGLLSPGWFLHAQALFSDGGLPGGVGQSNAVRIQW